MKPRRIKKITVEKRKEGWVILDPNNETYPVSDPYDTKEQAMEDKRGQEKFWKYYHNRSSQELEQLDQDFRAEEADDDDGVD